MASYSGSQTVTEAWIQSDANGYPYGSMIALDSQENVAVTGWLLGSYIITKKYDPDGNLLWEQHYSVPDYEAVATWVLVDPFDNIIVTGYPRSRTSNPVEVGLLTLKYDTNGNLLWDDTYSGTWAFAVRGISDANGNIYVAGRAWFGTHDFVTIKYAPDGTRLWVDVFDQNSGFHTPNSMDLDSQGNLIINGRGLSGGFITVLYNTDGVRQWVIEQFGNTTGWVKLTGDGFFYLTGSFYSPSTSTDIWLLKYDLSGNLIWERNYDFGVTTEYGTSLTLDSQGNVIVTGIHSGGYSQWITIKVNPQGTLLWSNMYGENPYNDGWPSFIMTGPDDEVYVTGVGGPPPPPCCMFRSMATLRYNSDGSNPWTATYYPTSQRGVGLVLASDNSVYVAGDYMLTVIKYTQSGTGGGLLCEDIFFFNAKCNANGAAQAMVKMSGDFSGETVTFDLDGSPQLVTLMSNGTNSIGKMTVPHAGMGSHTVTLTDPAGCYSPVTFSCQVDAPPDPEWDALWAEYETLEQMQKAVPSEVKIIGNYPNPFNPLTSISYAISVDGFVSLKVYNSLGEEVAALVNEFQTAGYKSVTWNGRNDAGTAVASGLYFYRLTAGNVVLTEKMMFMK